MAADPVEAPITALALRPAATIQPASALPDRSEFNVMVAVANHLAKATGFIPSHFGGSPAKVLAAIMYGRDLGFSPTQSLQHIIVIDGKATTDAQAAGMLIRRAGHKLHDDTTDDRSIVTITRWDEPSHPYKATFSIADAQRAGLVKAGSGWAKYPRSMLYARALMECARKACQDALMGVAYVAEEMGADVDATGHAIAPEYQTGAEPVALEQDLAAVVDGEIIPEQASAESRAAVAEAGEGAEALPVAPPATSDTPAVSPASERARQGVGPKPKRTNVVQVPAAEPAPTTAPAATQAPSLVPEPAPATTTAAVAPEPADAFAPTESAPDERGEWVKLIRHQAARLWLYRVRQRNRKAALEGKALIPEPKEEPSEDADRALNIFIQSQLPEMKTLNDLAVLDMQNLHDVLAKMVEDSKA